MFTKDVAGQYDDYFFRTLSIVEAKLYLVE
jgi:hypothetical protein